MPNQIRYPVDHILLKAKRFHHFLRFCRPFLLLEFTIFMAIFLLCRPDSDIVHIGSRFQNIKSLLFQMLFFPHQLRKTVHLHEMLNSRRVTSVKLNHFPVKIV